MAGDGKPCGELDGRPVSVRKQGNVTWQPEQEQTKNQGSAPHPQESPVALLDALTCATPPSPHPLLHHIPPSLVLSRGEAAERPSCTSFTPNRRFPTASQEPDVWRGASGTVEPGNRYQPPSWRRATLALLPPLSP